MHKKELQEKALELARLEWWLANPTVKSFYLSVEHDGDDEGHFYKTVENRTFDLTTDTVEDPDFDDDNRYFDYENHPNFYTTEYYPVDIRECNYSRVYRPFKTDAEIQDRIDTILSMINSITLTSEERTKLAITAKTNSAGIL